MVLVFAARIRGQNSVARPAGGPNRFSPQATRRRKTSLRWHDGLEILASTRFVVNPGFRVGLEDSVLGHAGARPGCPGIIGSLPIAASSIKVPEGARKKRR